MREAIREWPQLAQAEQSGWLFPDYSTTYASPSLPNLLQPGFGVTSGHRALKGPPSRLVFAANSIPVTVEAKRI
jgi:hypothetical protein